MRRYIWAGFISFFVVQFLQILNAYLLGDLNSIVGSHAFFKLFLYYPVGAGLFGMLFGAMFKKLFTSWPFQNEYANGALWVTVIDMGLVILMKNEELKLNADTVVTIIIHVLTGLFFVKLATIFDKSKTSKKA